MKKFILLLITLSMGLNLFSQEVIPPNSWSDLYENYSTFLLSYAGIAGVAMFLGESLIRLLKATVKWQKVTIVIIIAIIVSFIGNLVNIGYLAEATWWETILWGILSGIAATGLWSSNLAGLKNILEYLVSFIKKKV